MAAMTPRCAANRLLLRGRRGNALVEFALVLPVLLLMFAGIIDFAFLFQRYQVLTNAVREGARIAVLPANFGLNDVIAPRVRDYVRLGLGVPTVTASDVPVTLTSEDVAVGTGHYTVITIRASLTYNYLVIGHVARLMGASDGPWGSIALHAASTMRLEVQ